MGILGIINHQEIPQIPRHTHVSMGIDMFQVKPALADPNTSQLIDLYM